MKARRLARLDELDVAAHSVFADAALHPLDTELEASLIHRNARLKVVDTAENEVDRGLAVLASVTNPAENQRQQDFKNIQTEGEALLIKEMVKIFQFGNIVSMSLVDNVRIDALESLLGRLRLGHTSLLGTEEEPRHATQSVPSLAIREHAPIHVR